MGEVPLSLHVDAALKKKLNDEARLLEVSESEIAGWAIQAYLDVQAHKRDVVEAVTAEAEKEGLFISSEAILDWMDRLEQDLNAQAPEPDVVPPSRG